MTDIEERLREALSGWAAAITRADSAGRERDEVIRDRDLAIAQLGTVRDALDKIQPADAESREQLGELERLVTWHYLPKGQTPEQAHALDQMRADRDEAIERADSADREVAVLHRKYSERVAEAEEQRDEANKRAEEAATQATEMAFGRTLALQQRDEAQRQLHALRMDAKPEPADPSDVDVAYDVARKAQDEVADLSDRLDRIEQAVRYADQRADMMQRPPELLDVIWFARAGEHDE